MKNLNMNSAIKRYNNLMQSLGVDYLSMAAKINKWTIRDMVCECDYLLSTYYENDHENGEMQYSYFKNVRQVWRSETAKLKRFIVAYLPFCEGIKCTEYHCSQYDTEVSPRSNCSHLRSCSRKTWQMVDAK